MRLPHPYRVPRGVARLPLAPGRPVPARTHRRATAQPHPLWPEEARVAMSMSDPPANMSFPNDPGTSNGARTGDAEAMDAICRLLNTVGSATDVAEGIAMIVAGTGRPYVDDLAVVEATVGESVHGLPRAE